MNNIVSKVLLIIVILLIALFAYKTLKVPSPTSAEIAININDQSSTQLNEVKKTEKIIQEYLLNNPEIIIQAMEILQQGEKQKVDFKGAFGWVVADEKLLIRNGVLKK